MSNTQHVFDFLDQRQPALPGVVVLFGDEPFLKRLARLHLLDAIQEDADDPPTVFSGETAEWRDVIDTLTTRSLFSASGRRLVIVEEADAFVTAQRARLEDYVASPRTCSLLLLEVAAWAGNTRLYKAIDAAGLQIECRPPGMSGKRKTLDEKQLCKWLGSRATQAHDARLSGDAARELVDVVGPEFGLLDQNLAKLALYADPGGEITRDMVRDIVGGWRAKTTWDLVDAAADGNAGEALRQLDRLLRNGEHPLALFGQISWSLRRFAAATRLFEQAERQRRRLPLREALIDAGIPHWNRRGLDRAERQLKQLGRGRAGSIYRWLLDADLALKGSHSAPSRARFVLEQLILKLAQGGELRAKS